MSDTHRPLTVGDGDTPRGTTLTPAQQARLLILTNLAQTRAGALAADLTAQSAAADEGLTAGREVLTTTDWDEQSWQALIARAADDALAMEILAQIDRALQAIETAHVAAMDYITIITTTLLPLAIETGAAQGAATLLAEMLAASDVAAATV